MLLELRVRNFRSIRDEIVLSFEATPGKELPHVVRHPDAELPKRFRGALPTVVLYGANGSGKSNVLLAARTMRTLVEGVAREQASTLIKTIQPFRLSSQTTQDMPTLLEASFIENGIRFNYGMEVQDGIFKSEWLRAWPSGVEQTWFLRGIAAASKGTSAWYFGPSFEGGTERGKLLSEQTRDDTSFVSVACQFNHKQAAQVVSWFLSSTAFVDHTEVFNRGKTFTQAQSIKEPDLALWINHVLAAADTGIAEVRTYRRRENLTSAHQGFLDVLKDEHRSDVEKELLREFQYATATFHIAEDGRRVAFDLDNDESHGTRRLFALLGPLRDVLQYGLTLWVDELNTGLHPWLVRYLITLFQDPELNPNCAQLVLTTHDALLLDSTLLRRDQICFTEKSHHGSTELVRLSDIRGVRLQSALYKQYLSGRFGGVPSIDPEVFLRWSEMPESVSVRKVSKRSRTKRELEK